MNTLVLLPGMDGTGELFADFKAALADNTESAVISYPSSQAMDYHALEHWVRARLPVGQPYFLLGESFSGPIAIRIAASAPASLRGLILCCSFARSPLHVPSFPHGLLARLPVKHMPAAITNTMLLGRHGSDPLKLALRRAIAAVSPAVFRGRLHCMLEVDVRAQARCIGLPVLYLRAKSDRLVCRARATEIKRCIPQCEVMEIDGPHALLQCAPIATANAVTQFLVRCHSPSR